MAGVSRALLKEVVRRVVEAADPERIILFGSAARGRMTPDSDLDLLVVKSKVNHRRRLAQKIYLNLFGIPTPIDVIVVTPQDIDLLRVKPGTVIGPALREGRVIYAA
jgi:predicted nucleotidyltransferase